VEHALSRAGIGANYSWCRAAHQRTCQGRIAIYRHILIPTDGSDLSGRAVAEGVKLATELGSRLTFVAVMVPFAGLGDLSHAYSGLPETIRRQAIAFLEAEAHDALSKAMSAATSVGINSETLMAQSDQPHEAIIAAAKSKNADLILMGSHGRSGAKAVILGSVTQKVLAHTHLPVLVCR
jgi:nucleotide-binding universal stress UspA family protein